MANNNNRYPHTTAIRDHLGDADLEQLALLHFLHAQRILGQFEGVCWQSFRHRVMTAHTATHREEVLAG